MDDKYRIGSGTVGAGDFDDIDSSNPATPSMVGGLDDPLSSNNDYSNNSQGSSDEYVVPDYKSPDFLTDPNSYNNVPGFLEDGSTDITTYSSDPSVDDTSETEIDPYQINSTNDQSQETDLSEIDYGYNTNLEQDLMEDINTVYTPPSSFEQIETEPKQDQIQQQVYPQEDFLQPGTNEYDNDSRGGGINILNWLGTFAILGVCFGLVFLLFMFLNSGQQVFDIAGISNKQSQAQSIVNQIEEYFVVLQDNDPLVTPTEDQQIQKNEYWRIVSEQGLIILDDINLLDESVGENDQIRNENGDTIMLKDFVETSKEYVSFHTRLSEIMTYVEIETELITNKASTNDDLLNLIMDIDDLRAGILNSKGELSEMLDQTEDLRTESIINYYFDVLNEYDQKLLNLKKSVSFGDKSSIERSIKALRDIYNLEEQSIAETKYYVDYTTQKSVKALTQ